MKASEEEIARSLEGNWQEEHLFVLQQEQDGYQFCLKQMAECDQRLQQYLQQQEDRSQGANLPEEKRNHESIILGIAALVYETVILASIKIYRWELHLPIKVAEKPDYRLFPKRTS